MSIRTLIFMSVAFLLSTANAAPEATKMKMSQPAAKRAAASQSSTLSAATMAPSAMNAKNTALSLENYFPAAGKGALTIKPAYKTGTASGTFRSTTGERFEASKQSTSNTMEVEGVYAMSPKWAISVSNSVGEDKEDHKINSPRSQDFTLQGLSDFKITAKAHTENAGSHMFYGATYSWSPEARDYNVGNTTSNRYSGGNSINPYFSAEKNSGANNVIGMRISYLMLEDRALTVKNQTETSKQSIDGGNTLSLGGFNEFHKADYVVGVAGNLSFVDSSTWKANAGNARILGADAATLLNAKVYGMSKSAGNWEVVPALAFTTNLNRGSANTYETNDEIAINVAARLPL